MALADLVRRRNQRALADPVRLLAQRVLVDPARVCRTLRLPVSGEWQNNSKAAASLAPPDFQQLALAN